MAHAKTKWAKAEKNLVISPKIHEHQGWLKTYKSLEKTQAPGLHKNLEKLPKLHGHQDAKLKTLHYIRIYYIVI
jgi:hypothetical protein